MKKLFAVCLVLVLCFGLASASAETNPLLGTWRWTFCIGGGYSEDMTVYGDMYAIEYTFNADYTFVCTATQFGERSVVMSGTYRIDGNYVIMTTTGTDGSYTFTRGFTFGDGTLVLAGEEIDGVFYVDYYNRAEQENQ